MKKHLPILLIVICAGAFVSGIGQLFKLRFEVGDVYPAYSSLRSDPLGTMAFYESLDALPGISVRRDHSSANKLPEGRGTAYLHLAALTSDWDELPMEQWKELDAFLLSGGRLVITFYPETGQPFRPFATRTQAGKSAAQKQGKQKKSRPAEPRYQSEAVNERWGVEFDYRQLAVGDTGAYEPVEVERRDDLPLPPSLAWHSATVFTNLNQAWKPIYTRGTNAVVIERRFGRGTVVMATDSYFLSNQALREERQVDLLAWFVGTNARVLFDEAHHGIMDTSGVATLIRNYRLHGLAAGLLVLAALFIWKNSLSLVPPHAAEKPAGHVAGKDAAAGFVNLLRRNIRADDVLAVCFAEWTKSLYQGRYYTITAVTQAQAVMEEELKRPPRARDPVKAYQTICGILKSDAPRTPHQKEAARSGTSEH